MALRTAAGVSLAYILLPMFFVIWLAFFAQEIPSFPPEGYSLKWFRAIPGNDRFVTGFLLSLQVAVVATSIGLAIGVPAAVCLVRGRFRGREAVNNLLLLPLIVPGIVLGIALYVFHVETEIATGWPDPRFTRRPDRRSRPDRDTLDGAPDHGEPRRHGSRRRGGGAKPRRRSPDHVPAHHVARPFCRASSRQPCLASSPRSEIWK